MTYTLMTARHRVVLRLNGNQMRDWVSFSVHRDLREISGSFEFAVLDAGRIAEAGGADAAAPPMVPGMAASIAIDGELVLIGWIDEVRPSWHASQRGLTIQGRDKTGDLVDCAAAPNGPAEYRGLGLLAIAQAISQPFGISVRADVDLGLPFPRLALNPHETAMATIEKAARQRSCLPVSDGVGGLLLTRGGTTTGPAPLNCGHDGNAIASVDDAGATLSWKKRFSDYYVKGQSEAAAGGRGTTPLLGHDVAPGAAMPPAAGTPTKIEQGGVLMTGHAIDPEITRWRPAVRVTRTQSGASSAQEQAEWALRVARGESKRLAYSVPDFRAGAGKGLWRPNQVVTVVDPYAGIDKPMLIDTVTFEGGPEGFRTKLGVVGPSAYDRIDEPAKRVSRKGNKSGGTVPDP